MSFLQIGFSLNGDESSFEMTADVGIPSRFEAHCPVGFRWLIRTIEIIAVDAAIQPSRFLGEAGSLVNGIQLQIHDDVHATEIDFLSGALPDAAIKTTADLLAGFATSFVLLDTPGGSADDMLVAYAHASELNSSHPLAILTPGQHLAMVIRDDISGVTSLRAKVGVDQVPLRHGGT